LKKRRKKSGPEKQRFLFMDKILIKSLSCQSSTFTSSHECANQGDQTSFFLNITQYVAQLPFSKLMHILQCGKSSPKVWATFIFFKKPPKENNHPMG
jgi:hypothetical protein